MPRRTRMYLPGLPYHLVQRGNNREPCFLEPENYQFYLELWETLSHQYGVLVHGYCLMTNHIHFLVALAYAWAKQIGSQRQSLQRRRATRRCRSPILPGAMQHGHDAAWAGQLPRWSLLSQFFGKITCP